MTRGISRREFAAAGIGWLPWNWSAGTAGMAGIDFEIVKNGPDRRRYIWIHGNEKTAYELLRAHMKNVNGRAFFIKSKDRNVPISGGQIDPNRMFSRVGAEANLRKLNPEWTEQQIERALDRLDGGREGFLRTILPRPGNVIVALHNNSPGYSVKDEVPISDMVALNDREHPDEFMLCTIRSDFEVLAGGPFNVVLQHSKPAEDDGSLSRLCAARGVRYVNIEAEHGNDARQKAMLDWLERIL